MNSSTSFWDHPIAKIEEALALKKQIAVLQEKLSDLFSINPPSLSATPTKRGKRKMSPAARAKIAAAQKARWAKVKTGTTAKPAKKSGGLTPEGRARLAASMKARWAAKKKGETKTAGKAKPAKKSGGITPAGRAKLAAAMKARWAAKKKAAAAR